MPMQRRIGATVRRCVARVHGLDTPPEISACVSLPDKTGTTRLVAGYNKSGHSAARPGYLW